MAYNQLGCVGDQTVWKIIRDALADFMTLRADDQFWQDAFRTCCEDAAAALLGEPKPSIACLDAAVPTGQAHNTKESPEPSYWPTPQSFKSPIAKAQAQQIVDVRDQILAEPSSLTSPPQQEVSSSSNLAFSLPLTDVTPHASTLCHISILPQRPNSIFLTKQKILMMLSKSCRLISFSKPYLPWRRSAARR